MKDNAFLIAGLLGVGALLLNSTNTNNTSTNTNNTSCPPPNRLVMLNSKQAICETELPAMGYIKYKGIWYHQSQFQPSGQYAGTNPNSQQWQNILVSLISTGFDLYNLFTDGKDPGGQFGDTGATGSF